MAKKGKKMSLTLKGQLEEANERFHNSDEFLGKDILGLANKMNSSRNIMLNSHLEQCLVAESPETPRMFTGYEKMVGTYSSSYRQAQGKTKIIKKIEKFKGGNEGYCYLLITKDGAGNYDVIYRQQAHRLTESYCYQIDNTTIDNLNDGDTVEDGETLYRSVSFDEHMNYRYGKNAKTVYMIDNRTTEDAIVCSESFAKSFTHSYLHEIEVSVNSNDILCNLYGGEELYKPFPEIGDETLGKILVARRRINYQNSIFDLLSENLRKIQHEDQVKYAHGTLIDIDIYCNSDIENLERFEYNSQIVKYFRMQEAYNKEIVKALEPIIKKHSKKCSDDLKYTYKRAKDSLNPDIHWRNESSDFDNIVIVFKILETNKGCNIGTKLTGRCGNKGTISAIVPDDQMPVSEDGTRADLILNALGIVNRLNPAQLYEVSLNFIARKIHAKIKEEKTAKGKLKWLFELLDETSPYQSKELKKYVKGLDKTELKQFLKDLDKDGIFLHQPPFWGNVTFKDLMNIYKKFPWIKPDTCYINGKKISKPLIIADQYIMKLKHEPLSKFSARSTSYINTQGNPSKSRSFVNKSAVYSTTPVRLGEMEYDNLILAKDTELLTRINSLYSNSVENRQGAIEYLLTQDVLDIEEIPMVSTETNHNRKILDAYFKSLGIKLID